MEQGFIKASSANLPRIDLIMLGTFLASNKDFCSGEFRNVKTSMSARASYGDDARRTRYIPVDRTTLQREHTMYALEKLGYGQFRGFTWHSQCSFQRSKAHAPNGLKVCEGFTSPVISPCGIYRALPRV
ncbi:hypothetical protein EVAR_39616_1 [Eumeta japonica]|uniref:Uncharacterized protein n=1 Tax=Eumeta variegata TaxID=151549 RepID=A0A4C1WGS1_EUMVA|nr:hypothetical protein EVAR_39616_1 [Eumeta japonica]